MVTLHQGDIPADLGFGNCVAVDAEMMGLKPERDRLCLIQISSGDENAHIIQLKPPYDAPNLKKMLTDPKVTKLFHYARLDIVFIWTYLNVLTAPLYCTKIASRLARTYTEYHGLKHVCKDLLNIELDKQQQTTNWGADTLTPEQLQYAASDVLHLHQLKDRLDALLAREGRLELAQACFNFLPARALLDAAGWTEEDIFAH
jgi:ribonuclease D